MPTPYVTMSDMSGIIPGRFLLEALDDDGDGLADPGKWDDVVLAVHKEIDGILGTRYEVPFNNPIPAPVAAAAPILAGEKIYLRRGYGAEEGKANPFAGLAKQHRATLQAIADGAKPLGPDKGRTAPSASIVAEPSRASSRAGRNAL